MKKLVFATVLLFFNCGLLFSQVSINTDGSPPDISAILDIKSTGKGVLIPRMTFEQRNALVSPAEGLMIFCLDCGVDGSLSLYCNSAWKSLSTCSSITPAAGVNEISTGQIIWHWCAANGALGYKWNTANNYTTAFDVGSGCSKTETGIVGNTDYIRYVWSYNACSSSSPLILTATTFGAPPASPVPGTHVASWNQIIWNWSTVADATGYKWNTVNNYTSAMDMAGATSKTEAGLTCGTAYTRYVWAYNGYGYSASVALTQSTLTCSTCGTPVTISHVAGNVAPVTKTVTYGTVTNVPGEPTKCWITSNLGADHQATAVNDATEPSAGWYWQFNRMQGYKHDGSTRTPNLNWITEINEYSTWTSVNDPCTIELGSGWRVPTIVEWNNVDAAGNWVNYNGPWNSLLKMHLAGRIDYFFGTLVDRGSKGYSWSSEQTGLLTTAQGFFYTSSFCGSYNMQKSYANSVRCLRD